MNFVFLNSAASLETHDNTLADFTVRLPEPLHVAGYKLGLSELFHPSSIQTITKLEKHNKIKIYGAVNSKRKQSINLDFNIENSFRTYLENLGGKFQYDPVGCY